MISEVRILGGVPNISWSQIHSGINVSHNMCGSSIVDEGVDVTFPGKAKFSVFSSATVDGRNPAPVDMVNFQFFTGFYTSQVVQDFFHQQYVSLLEGRCLILLILLDRLFLGD